MNQVMGTATHPAEPGSMARPLVDTRPVTLGDSPHPFTARFMGNSIPHAVEYEVVPKVWVTQPETETREETCLQRIETCSPFDPSGWKEPK